MAISVKHLFTSAKADGTDSTLVQPSNWNAEHTITLAAGKVLGRSSASSGAMQELPLSIDSTGQSMIPPIGTTGERPATAATGMFRFNTTTTSFEGYNGAAWGSIIVNDASGNVAVGGTLAMGSSFKRNRIINGNMLIDQRNAGASVSTTAATTTYFVDRWFTNPTQTGKFTVQQNAGPVTPPTGFSYYLGAVSTSAYAVTAADYFYVSQAIEGYNFSDLGFGTASAKTITVSFVVYSSLTGTFAGSLRNYAGTRSYPFSYSIPVANTWTTISVTIPGDTSGTWVGGTNAGSAILFFSLGTGSTFSATAGAWAAGNYVSATGAVSVVGTAGATFYVTGVQLEVGTEATPYEMQIYSDQLVQCCRYYQPLGGSITLAVPYVVTSTLARQAITFPVTMRTSPTVVLSTPSYTNTSSLSVVSNDAYTVSLGWLTTAAGGAVSSVALNATAEL